MPKIRRRLIQYVYHALKGLGLFRLSRHLTRNRLRILCYHGFAIGDEGDFRPSLFSSRATFERRMRYLQENGHPVLSIRDAMTALEKGDLPDCAVVITIDDGFYSVHAVAKPILDKFGYPALMYLTTYNFKKSVPIFNLAIAYMCWKSSRETIDLSGLGIPEFDEPQTIGFGQSEREFVREKLVDYGHQRLSLGERNELATAFGQRVGVDYGEIVRSRILSLVTKEELEDLCSGTMEIGMHTHRHRMSRDEAELSDDLRTNRKVIENVTKTRTVDFCYPSGEWSTDHWPVLARCGIARATTCESGLVGQDAEPLALPRILDDDRVSMIEFEAEISGMSEILRRIRGIRNDVRP